MRKTPEQRKEFAASCRIEELGWNQHSRDCDKKRAFQGNMMDPIKSTGWHDSWVKVLAEIENQPKGTV